MSQCWVCNSDLDAASKCPSAHLHPRSSLSTESQQYKVFRVSELIQEVVEIRAELAERDAQIAVYREALGKMLTSAYPHPVEHPTMTEAWAHVRAVLANPAPAAEALLAKAKLVDEIDVVRLREVASLCQIAQWLPTASWLRDLSSKIEAARATTVPAEGAVG